MIDRELVMKYLDVTKSQKTVDAFVESVEPHLKTLLKMWANGDERLESIAETVVHEMTLRVFATAASNAVGILSDLMTAEEATAAIQYYSSPAGASLVGKLPEISRRSREAMDAMMPALVREGQQMFMEMVAAVGRDTRAN